MPLGRPTEVGLGPGDVVLDGDPPHSQPKGGTAAPSYRPMSIVAKQSPNCWTRFCDGLGWISQLVIGLGWVKENGPTDNICSILPPSV